MKIPTGKYCFYYYVVAILDNKRYYMYIILIFQDKNLLSPSFWMF